MEISAREHTLAPVAESEFVRFGPVHLDVVRLDRSVAWWRDVVGLEVLEEDSGRVELGLDDAKFVVLRATATSPVARGYSGLYHLAIQVPDEPSLAQVLSRLGDTGVRLGMTDHVVAKSLYLNDPDGIGLEIAVETPERVAVMRLGADGREPEIIDTDGNQRRGLEPLDVEQVLARLPEADRSRPFAAGTKIGHVNLHVAALDAAIAFYRDGLGFLPSNYVPLGGWGDLGTGRRFTHRIAVNVWQGAGAPPRPREAAGMDHFTLRFDSEERLRSVLARLPVEEEQAEGYIVHDPAGNAIVLTA